MRRLLLTCLCMAAAATGCGDDGSAATAGTPEEQVRATLSALTEADRSGDYDRYCNLLSSASARSLVQLGGAGGDCPAAMRSTMTPGHAAATTAALAVDVTVTGDRALARIPDDGNGVALVREDGRWRVELFGAQGLPANATPAAPAAPPAPPAAAMGSRHDSAAKSDARAAVSSMEACFTDANTYVGCRPTTAGGPVEVLNPTATSYEVLARTDAGAEYRIRREPTGMFQRVCAAPVATTSCQDGTW